MSSPNATTASAGDKIDAACISAEHQTRQDAFLNRVIPGWFGQEWHEEVKDALGVRIAQSRRGSRFNAIADVTALKAQAE